MSIVNDVMNKFWTFDDWNGNVLSDDARLRVLQDIRRPKKRYLEKRDNNLPQLVVVGMMDTYKFVPIPGLEDDGEFMVFGALKPFRDSLTKAEMRFLRVPENLLFQVLLPYYKVWGNTNWGRKEIYESVEDVVVNRIYKSILSKVVKGDFYKDLFKTIRWVNFMGDMEYDRDDKVIHINEKSTGMETIAILKPETSSANMKVILKDGQEIIFNGLTVDELISLGYGKYPYIISFFRNPEDRNGNKKIPYIGKTPLTAEQQAQWDRYMPRISSNPSEWFVSASTGYGRGIRYNDNDIEIVIRYNLEEFDKIELIIIAQCMSDRNPDRVLMYGKVPYDYIVDSLGCPKDKLDQLIALEFIKQININDDSAEYMSKCMELFPRINIEELLTQYSELQDGSFTGLLESIEEWKVPSSFQKLMSSETNGVPFDALIDSCDTVYFDRGLFWWSDPSKNWTAEGRYTCSIQIGNPLINLTIKTHSSEDGYDEVITVFEGDIDFTWFKETFSKFPENVLTQSMEEFIRKVLWTIGQTDSWDKGLLNTMMMNPTLMVKYKNAMIEINNKSSENTLLEDVNPGGMSDNWDKALKYQYLHNMEENPDKITENNGSLRYEDEDCFISVDYMMVYEESGEVVPKIRVIVEGYKDKAKDDWGLILIDQINYFTFVLKFPNVPKDKLHYIIKTSFNELLNRFISSGCSKETVLYKRLMGYINSNPDLGEYFSKELKEKADIDTSFVPTLTFE